MKLPEFGFRKFRAFGILVFRWRDWIPAPSFLNILAIALPEFIYNFVFQRIMEIRVKF